ncbi:SGNH hydrolase domain-containing protein [Proteus mirabilis]|uniref:SGNH hydrolase domain-containing protein n=1 Tax=Proteus mirabilis TaxID=584 RepID=UPI003D01F338
MSYSIYLIHWPFIVFFKKINIEISIFTYFISTILLAFIIYSIIEKRRDYSYGLILCWILSVGVSYYVSIDGVGNRVDEKYKLTSKEFHREYFGGSAIKQASVIQEFNIDNNDNPQAIITGDSFSRQYMNSFKKSGFKAIGIFKDGCFITPNYYSKFESNDNRLCKLRYDNFIKVMKEHPKTNVILSMSWGSYKLTDKNTDREIKDNSDSIIINELSELIKIGGHLRKYYIIGRPNGSEKSSFECLARNNLPINRIITHCELFSERKIISINDELKKLETLYNNVTIIDPNDVLCKENECILLDKDGEPIYSDSSHLSIFGANIVVEYILKKIN